MNSTEYRIGSFQGWLMISVAALFDLAQVAAKIFILAGLTILAAAGGAVAGEYVGAAGIGSFIGGIIGAFVSATGVGTAAALTVGYLLNLAFSWIALILGYATLILWFWMSGVTIISGERAATKTVLTLCAALTDTIPFLNILPGMTLWTIFTIRESRREDKQRAASEAARYNGRTTRRERRRGAPSPANDNVPTAAQNYDEYRNAA